MTYADLYMNTGGFILEHNKVTDNGRKNWEPNIWHWYPISIILPQKPFFQLIMQLYTINNANYQQNLLIKYNIIEKSACLRGFLWGAALGAAPVATGKSPARRKAGHGGRHRRARGKAPKL